MISEVDPDLTTYLNELLETSEPEQQNNISWFPTPKNHSKTEAHSSITQYRHESSRTFSRKRRKKNWTPQTKLNQEENSWNDLTEETHCSLQLRNKLWKTLSLSIIHFRQTSIGYWDECGSQGETHSGRGRNCSLPKLSNPDPPENKCWAGSDAQIWDHHSTNALFKV